MPLPYSGDTMDALQTAIYRAVSFLMPLYHIFYMPSSIISLTVVEIDDKIRGNEWRVMRRD